MSNLICSWDGGVGQNNIFVKARSDHQYRNKIMNSGLTVQDLLDVWFKVGLGNIKKERTLMSSLLFFLSSKARLARNLDIQVRPGFFTSRLPDFVEFYLCSPFFISPQGFAGGSKAFFGLLLRYLSRRSHSTATFDLTWFMDSTLQKQCTFSQSIQFLPF